MGTQRFGKKEVMHIFFLRFLTFFFAGWRGSCGCEGTPEVTK
jgi:hypothetical protein